MHTHIAKDARCIVEDGVDTHCLLEHAEHDTDEDAHETISHQFLRLHGDCLLDVLQNLLGLRRTVDLRQDAQSLLVLTNHHQITRSLGNEADEQGEETCGHSLGSEHIAPTRSDSPLCSGIDGGNTLTHFLNKRLDVFTENEEVDKVDNQLTEDNGKLVPGNKHASDIRGCYLTDIHGADGRCQTDTDTADNTIDVEHDEQRKCGSSVLKEQKFWIHATKSRDEEEDTSYDERTLTAEACSQQARESRTDDAADQSACRREAVPSVGVTKIFCLHEESLQALLGT